MVQGVVVENGLLHNVNPATGEVFAKVPTSTPADVTEAVRRATVAQADWALLSAGERAEYIKKALVILGTRKEEAVEMMVKEMGKIREEASDELDGAISKDLFIELIVEANKDIVKENGLIVRDPIGVVAVISPWNFPADEILLLSIPALIAGNAVIVKPSEVTPLTGQIVVECLQAALPSGVVNLLHGDGVVGKALVESDVQMVAMTGSSATGKKIMAGCAKDLKRIVLELGGKDPMIVFADADLEQAAIDCVDFSLYNCGQVCCSVERVYIAESVKPQFEKLVKKAAEAYVAGEGNQPSSKIGPLVSAMQRDNVDNQVQSALKNGATKLYQGQYPVGSKGYFYPATVLSDVGQSLEITRNETFGPVVAISSFDGTEKSAVALANDTEYGLAAYVYTRDLEKARRVGKGIKAGQIGINNWSMMKAPTACPWVGHKGSGHGFHSGTDGWRQFSVPKSLIFNEANEVAVSMRGKGEKVGSDDVALTSDADSQKSAKTTSLFTAGSVVLAALAIGFMVSARK